MRTRKNKLVDQWMGDTTVKHEKTAALSEPNG